MRFIPNQQVKHAGNHYQAGDEYDVPEGEAKFMASHGWGSAPDLPPNPGEWSEPVTITTAPVTLQPHDGAIGQSSQV